MLSERTPLYSESPIAISSGGCRPATNAAAAASGELAVAGPCAAVLVTIQTSENIPLALWEGEGGGVCAWQRAESLDRPFARPKRESCAPAGTNPPLLLPQGQGKSAGRCRFMKSPL